MTFKKFIKSKLSVVLECDFKEDHGQYSCVVSKLNVSSKSFVTNVTGEHQREMSNADVKGLSINSQISKFLPSGIEKFFPNLEIFSFYQTYISSISASDLKPFPKITIFALTGTSFYVRDTPIQSLPGDLFKYNPLITIVQIEVDEISKVGETIFDNLPNLFNAYIKTAKCAVRAEWKEAIPGLKQKIKTECN